MVHFDLAVRTALDRFARAGHVSPVEHEGERLWNVEPGSRIGLEFYKNQILQFFVPAGLVAMALRALPDAPATRRGAGGRGRLPGLDLAAGSSASTPMEPSASWSATGWRRSTPTARSARRTRAGWSPMRSGVGEIHALFRNFAEAYLLVLRSIDEGATSKGLAKSLVARSEALLASGAVTRPESLSVITLQNAVAAFVEAGALSEVDGAAREGGGAVRGRRRPPGPDGGVSVDLFESLVRLDAAGWTTGAPRPDRAERASTPGLGRLLRRTGTLTPPDGSPAYDFTGEPGPGWAVGLPMLRLRSGPDGETWLALHADRSSVWRVPTGGGGRDPGRPPVVGVAGRPGAGPRARGAARGVPRPLGSGPGGRRVGMVARRTGRAGAARCRQPSGGSAIRPVPARR
jgi:hypothetical protein